MLEPVDTKRCQVDKRQATPFRLGGPPVTVTRCDNQPSVIIREKEVQPDGERGAMSCCATCLDEFYKQYGHDYADIEAIKATA